MDGKMLKVAMLQALTEELMEHFVDTVGTLRQGYEETLTAEEREASEPYQGVKALEELACDVYRSVTEQGEE
jgi:hypothetical protein